MAKKLKNFELDDYGFSNELDIPDFSFESAEVKDDRKPATRVAQAVIGGAKDTIKSPAFIRQMIKRSLPQGYGSAMGMADEAAGTLRSLYDETAKEIKPVIKDVKRATKRVLPAVEASLPQNVAAKIKKWAENDPDRISAALDAQQQRDAGIQMQLGEIFKLQAEADLKRDAKQEVQEQLGQGMQQRRHTDMLGQLDAMRVSLQQIASYQHRIDSAYQRKSLELQFRHYFVAADSLEEQKRMNAAASTWFQAIAKNTGLPEYVKLKNTERMAEMMRNKFLDSAQETLFGKRRDFLKNLGSKIIASGKEKLGTFLGDVQRGAGMVESLADLREMQESFGHKRTGGEFAGELAGGVLADTVGEKIGKKIRSYTSKNETINKLGNQLQYGVENAPQLAGEFARGTKFDDTPILGGLVRFLKDASLQSLSVDNTITQDTAGSMQAPDVFSRQTNKSITEIIPGYLARIYRELRIMRTGDDKVELTSYDFTNNSFNDYSAAGKSVFKSIVGEDEKASTKSSLDRLIGEIDRKGKLTAEERQALAIQLLTDNMNNRTGSAKRLSEAGSYSGKSAPHAQKFAELFKDYFADDTQGAKQQVFAQEFSHLGERISDSRKVIQDHVNTGNRDQLERLGLLQSGSDRINMDRLYELYLSDQNPSPATSSPRRVRRADAARSLPGTGLRRAGSSFEPGEFAGGSYPQDHATSVAPAAASGTQEIIAALKENSSKTISETMSQTLLRIEKRLNEGLLMADEGQGGGKTGSKRWWNKSIGEVGGNLWSAGTSMAGKAASFGNSLVQQGFSGALGALELGKKALSWGVGKFNAVKDVYVKGEVGPRLLAAKLKAGHYRDQLTGKVIKSYKDIQGAVVDELGNVVLAAEEIRHSFTKEGAKQKLLKAWGAVSSFGNELVSGALGIIPPAYRAGVMLLQKAYGLLSLPQDVYVRGKPDPVLLARTMKAGGYFSRLTGKAIRHPGDIDGVVLDDQANVVLSSEDLAGGILDKNGRPIRTGLAKLVGMAGDALQTGQRLLKSASSAVGRTVAKLMKGVKGFGGGIRIGGAGESSIEEAMLLRLSQIRDLLDQRLPARKKKIAGDLTGDGVREGSYEDLLAKRQKKTSPTQPGQAPAASNAGAPAGKSLLGSLWDKLRGKKEGDGDSDVDINIGGGGGNTPTGGTKPPKKPAPKGFWGKAGHYGKAMGRGAWGLTKGAATLGMGALGLGGLGLGSLVSGIGSAAAGLGSAAVGAGGALLSGAGAVLGGLATLISSPVVLGALAVGAVGLGGYMAYKYLTRKTLGPISKVRYAQYGFLPTDDKNVGAVFGLEDQLMAGVVWKDNIAGLDDKKIEVKKLLDTFDVDPEDKAATEKWMRWFAGRFKPVFLTHLTALRAVNPKASLDDVDGNKLTKEQKTKYLNISKWPGGPYDVMISPFPKEDSLQAGASAVEQAAQAAETEVAKTEDKPQQSPTGLISTAAAATLPATAGKVDTAGSAPAGAATSLVKTGATGAGLGASLAATKLSETGLSASGNEQVYTVATNAENELGDYTEGQTIDALFAVRLKAYGAEEFVSSVVAGIARLEYLVGQRLTFAKTSASWRGDIDSFVSQHAVALGIDDNTQTRRWMALRFLPVFLTYASAVSAQSGKTTLEGATQTLSKKQLLDIAKAVVAAKSPNGTSVWDVDHSPWAMVSMNTDMHSVADNMRALEVSVKDTPVAAEAKTDIGMKDKAKPGTLGDGKSKALEDAQAGQTKPTGFFDNLGNKISEMWNKAKETVTSAGQAAGTIIRDSATGIYNKAAETMGFTGGKEVTHPGGGTGGDINSLPLPKGKGTWESVKDLIIGAAKMAGVDEKLMATMAAVESGFDHTVKAATSSATGLYQFISETWKTMLKKYGAKYGIDPNTPATDARANALMGAEFLKENQAALAKSVSRPLTDVDLYLAHFLGAGGAKKFLTSPPDAVAANVMPQAARANASIFFDKGRPRSFAEVYAEITRRVRSKGKKFGLGVESAPAAGKPVEGATAQSTPESGKPEATTTVAKAPAAGSIIPVSDQTPGVSAQPTASTTPPTAQSSARASAPVDPAAAAAGSGFQSPRSRDLQAQAQYQREVSSQAIGEITPVLKETLGVNKQQLEVLLKIRDILASSAGSHPQQPARPVQTAETPTVSASATIQTGGKTARPMTAAPVSMAKANI